MQFLRRYPDWLNPSNFDCSGQRCVNKGYITNWKQTLYAVNSKTTGEDQPVRKVEIRRAGVVRNGAIQTAVPDAHLLFHQTGFSDAEAAGCVDLYLRALAAHAQPGMALERAWRV